MLRGSVELDIPLPPVNGCPGGVRRRTPVRSSFDSVCVTLYSTLQRCAGIGLSVNQRQEHALTKRLSEKSPMVHRIPLTQARNTLGQVVKRIHAEKQYVILERDGVAMAAIIDIDEFEDYLESHDPEIAAAIAESHRDYREGGSRPAADLLAELRSDR